MGWLPWRAVVSRIARTFGFLDPGPVLTRLEALAQPSEVSAPVELLRAGTIFHARGLVNARVIQYNLDWAWPYWVVRQYDPSDESFVPRAFSITHVNLTHRNWTAVGIPGLDRHPLVDPRGLVTPLYDGWSLDAWLVPEEGGVLLPARGERSEQELVLDSGRAESGLEVRTRVAGPAGRLLQRVDVIRDDGPWLRLRVRAEGTAPGWLALALRPANPEGVASIERVERVEPDVLRVNERTDVCLDRTPVHVALSTYRRGDVLMDLTGLDSAGGAMSTTHSPEEPEVAVECHARLVTAAALFRLDDEGVAEISVRVPLREGSRAEPGREMPGSSESGKAAGSDGADGSAGRAWRMALEGTAELRTPDDRFRFLYEAAVRSLVLHSPGDAYPGPYTYKRFWFRDAAFIIDALCSIGLGVRARAILSRYPARQEVSGYFRSQEGEWDSNGAALWAMDRYLRLTGTGAPAPWIDAARKAAEWIQRKRLDHDLEAPHAGLLPAGFSAEHLGPNDYFYWDDFWSVAGLQAAARMAREEQDADGDADRWSDEAGHLLDSVDRSVRASPGYLATGGVPASPYRRMDAGAVGSLAAGYPLRLWNPTDPRLLATVEHLLEHHLVAGGFFQDMIHSGINPYLTLHLAQILLRTGDPRQEALVRTVAGLASSTGQWPEAVHPRTGGGCMGDGQHVWASAEWVLMMRNWFVREDAGGLVLASGIPPEWIESGEPIEFGPTPTPHGPITVRITGRRSDARVEWDADWRGPPPTLDVRLPGHRGAIAVPEEGEVHVARTVGPGSSSPER